MGAYQKSRRDERPQTGVSTPSKCKTTEKVPKGRQKHKQAEIKRVTYSFDLSGLSFADDAVPGVTPPSVFSRTFGAFSLDSNNRIWFVAAAVNIFGERYGFFWRAP